MTTLKHKQLNLLIDLTNVMQQKAEHAEWEVLNKLEKQRQQFIKKFFPVNDGVSTDFQRSLEKLINLNRQLEHYCLRKKQDLQLEMQGFNNKKQAINAYKSV